MRSFARSLAALSVFALPATMPAQSTPAPKLVQQEGRHALLVDGSPYLVLGAQIGNSSAWPSLLEEKVWPALEAMHVNTAEAPVYWEQVEAEPGKFDWTNVDALLTGARQHHLHLILLWFGTWKNGNDHYVPQWVKRDTARYPRMINSAGNPIDDLSADSPTNLDADRKAFTALMHHLAEMDSAEHTVLMMQVENESGGIGAARDFSAASNREFVGAVPAELVKAMGSKPGTWSEVFRSTADESFQAWHQARYINAIVEAGKREFNIPMYCNVWLAYPPGELPERHIATPGIGYPSGGPNQLMLPLWKAAAPAIDLIGPDVYSSDPSFVLNILDMYRRPDNPLWIPEIGQGDNYAPFFFAALGRGTIGFSPFGVDWTGSHQPGSVPRSHATNYALIGPMARTLAKLNFEGRIQTAIEAAGGVDQQVLFTASVSAAKALSTAERNEILTDPATGANAATPAEQVGTPATRAADAAGDWVAEVRFGFPQRDGQPAPGSSNKEGRLLIAQLASDQFLLTGIGGSVFFHRPGYLPGIRMQILTAEEGYYTPSTTPGGTEVWHSVRILNGDETDRGIRFPDPMARPTNSGSQTAGGDSPPAATTRPGPLAVRITLGRF